ncbi:MAG: Serine/threonine-protein kinase [Chaenotheca gracillima]|nr:MAG: Serine/threonine-protein kinase [Chaenotheca gracillima]
MSRNTGNIALSGEFEEIQGFIFDAVDYDRKLTGHGASIQIYDPKAEDVKPIWEIDRTDEDETSTVPAGHVVSVIGATIKFEVLQV